MKRFWRRGEDRASGRRRNERVGWLQALRFWIGGVFFACPVLVGAALVALIGSELYGNLVSGEWSFHPGGFASMAVLTVPIVVMVTLLLMLTQAPVGALVLWLRERRASTLADWASVLLFHLQVVATFLLCLQIASPFLTGNTPTGDWSLGTGTISVCFLIAWLMQGMVLAIATQMARRQPA